MPINHNDYTAHMSHLKFEYDEVYYPEDKDLPDPQIDPVIPGARVPINKVGVSGVDLPVNFVRRDGTVEKLTTSVSLYGSLDNPNAKGLNLSRFPIVMHEQIADHVSIEGITHILDVLQKKQGSKDVYCKMKFKYPWTQKALRTRKELPADASDEQVFKIVEGVKLSHEKAEGYIYYNCVLEGQKHGEEYKFYLTVEYVSAEDAGTSYPTTTLRVKPNPTPIHENSEKAKSFIDEQTAITELYQELSYDELKNVLESWLDPTKSAQTTKSEKSVTEETLSNKSVSHDLGGSKVVDEPKKVSKSTSEVEAAFDDLFNS